MKRLKKKKTMKGVLSKELVTRHNKSLEYMEILVRLYLPKILSSNIELL